MPSVGLMRVAAYESAVFKDDSKRFKSPHPPSRSRIESEGSAGETSSPRPLSMIRALIAGRSRVHGEALAAALSHGRRVQVLATVSHPHEVLARLVEAPDIVLVDYATPEARSEEHTSELQSRSDLVCRLLLEKKKTETHRRRRRTQQSGAYPPRPPRRLTLAVLA